MLTLKNKAIFLFSSFNRIIYRSSSFFSNVYEHIDFNPLKLKILKSLILYTGYFIINIIGQSLNQYKSYLLEGNYNSFYKFVKFFISNFTKIKLYNFKKIKPKYNVQKVYKNLKKLVNIKKNIKYKYNIYLKFIKMFPFYLLKKFKNFINKMFYILILENYKLEYKYKSLINCFNYIFKSHNSHFFRAFKFYKIFLNNVYKCNLINTYGIKIIVKGRFGKVRKQIQKLVIGSLTLNSIYNNISYFKNILVTKRGSYGFHIWFSEPLNIKNFFLTRFRFYLI